MKKLLIAMTLVIASSGLVFAQAPPVPDLSSADWKLTKTVEPSPFASGLNLVVKLYVHSNNSDAAVLYSLAYLSENKQEDFIMMFASTNEEELWIARKVGSKGYRRRGWGVKSLSFEPIVENNKEIGREFILDSIDGEVRRRVMFPKVEKM